MAQQQRIRIGKEGPEIVTSEPATEDQLRTAFRQLKDDGVVEVREINDEDRAQLAKRLRKPLTWHNPRKAHEGGRPSSKKRPGRQRS